MISERNQVLFRLKLHHIGIAVKNIQGSLGELTKFLNFESTTVPTLVGSQKVNVCFLKTNDVYIELIEPAVENSPVSDFVKGGGGFHHLCFEVDDVNAKVSEFRNKGGIIVSPPELTIGWEKLGFENRLASFVYFDNLPVKLIEFISKK